MNEIQKQLFADLLPKYGVLLSQKQYCKLTGISAATAYRQRENGTGCVYKKLDSKSKNGTVVYPLHEVVKYISNIDMEILFDVERYSQDELEAVFMDISVELQKRGCGIYHIQNNLLNNSILENIKGF